MMSYSERAMAFSNPHPVYHLSDLGIGPTVAIYAEPLATPSWTAIRSQGSALRYFAPLYVTPKRMGAERELPLERIVAIRSGNSSLTRFMEIPFKVFGRAPIFFRRVRRFNPVLVHAHFGPCGLAVLPLSRWLGVPLVTTFHGSDVTTQNQNNYLHRRYFKHRSQLQEYGDLFIANSKFIYSKLLEQGFPAEKLIVHYIGVDTKFFCDDPRVVRGPIVLFVGILEEIKGCEFLIRAMAEVQSEFPNLELVVVGDGSQRANLESIASRLLRSYTFTGFEKPERVRDWMNRARILCLPGVRTDSGSEEAFGLVVAEALATGLPVIASGTGGIPEVIEDGQTGFLVKPRSVNGLATHISLLLRNKDLWTRLSRQGPVHIRRNFDLESQTARLETIYSEVSGVSLDGRTIHRAAKVSLSRD